MTPVPFEVRNLTVGYQAAGDSLTIVVADVSFELSAGTILGLAGESGCGKSTTAVAAMGYRRDATILRGESLLHGADLLKLATRDLRRYWGQRIAYIPQNAAASLNPSLTIERHLAEPLRRHRQLSGRALQARQLEILEAVHLPEPARALGRFPHQFSGGQQQRIALALALCCEPEVLILDEPTTGLDVTTQAVISKLFRALATERGLAVLYVSHDLALLATIADNLAIMYGGEIVERGPVAEVCGKPAHPYTRALYDAIPGVGQRRTIKGIPGAPPPAVVEGRCGFAPRCKYALDACTAAAVPLRALNSRSMVRCIRAESINQTHASADPASEQHAHAPAEAKTEKLAVTDLWCDYKLSRSTVQAVKGVSFAVSPGGTLGIVGESGSGKSTLLRAIIGLHKPRSGSITLDGKAVQPRAVDRPRTVRREIQLVFQNPDLSLNPRHKVSAMLRRPIRLLRDDVSRVEEDGLINDLLEAVKLSRGVRDRFPFELSGGQKQRIALARAFAARPSVLLCDEATSALDVSVQATIIELIAELARRYSTAIVFVSHDLAVVRTIAERALVMKDGLIREEGKIEQIFHFPQDPYTQRLVASVPEFAAPLA